MTDKNDTAGIIAPPPLIFISALASGYFLSRIYPLGHLPGLFAQVLAYPLFLAGVLCAVAALLVMRRARTPVDPYESTTALVIAGPYCFTRNPLYLSLTAFYIGSALLLNALWALVLLPLVLIVMVRGVIAREERYLEQKFGAAYQDYKAKVRRWL